VAPNETTESGDSTTGTGTGDLPTSSDRGDKPESAGDYENPGRIQRRTEIPDSRTPRRDRFINPGAVSK